MPLNLIHDRILGIDNAPVTLDQQEIVKFLVGHFFCVHLTREQHRRLRGTLMPPGWNWGEEPFARYHEVGLNVFGPPVRFP
jgi:hypothetical protein